jgi:hypothetical protein
MKSGITNELIFFPHSFENKIRDRSFFEGLVSLLQFSDQKRIIIGDTKWQFVNQVP